MLSPPEVATVDAGVWAVPGLLFILRAGWATCGCVQAFERFELKHYQNDRYPFPKADDKRDHVRGNYMYYPQSDVPVVNNPPAGQEEWRRVGRKTTELVAQRTITTDMIYTVRTRPHTTDRKPIGINALFGDMHVTFSTTKKAFDPKLWDPGDDHRSAQNPGDNAPKFRTIVGLLRP